MENDVFYSVFGRSEKRCVLQRFLWFSLKNVVFYSVFLWF